MAAGGRRVVVTGLGLVSPLGVGVAPTWSRLLRGESGVSPLADSPLVRASGHAAAVWAALPSQVAGMVPRGSEAGQLDPERDFPPAQRRLMSWAMKYGLMASHEAVAEAQLASLRGSRSRIGVAVGTAMVDLAYIAANYEHVLAGRAKKISPYFVPRILPNLAAGYISLEHGFQGPNHAVSTACATGSHAIGDAYRFIQCQAADVMICGGTEACIDPLAITGFARIRALSTRFNAHPATASRPFDRDRDGFVMAEGAGILVLEELEHARARGVPILAEILGYGLSGDADHITAAREDGQGAVAAMRAAFQDEGLAAVAQLWHINAHATSTPRGDKAELAAIGRLVGDQGGAWPHVSANKGHLGHLLGAAGSAEAILAIRSISTGLIPKTLNTSQLDADVPSAQRVVLGQNVDESSDHHHRRLTLKNSFGFGGTNVSLLMAKYTP
uniref:3-oxoacyl-[acyl-carrier-protein] synthase n=1 Tax=Tigriopus kingsejongensis TaxID=1133412 RepID=A0A343U6Y4_9MAXI|nr:3-oxoacyl-[acyl-carrier-protein] synthase [Tigriopus kingsejongensis]